MKPMKYGVVLLALLLAAMAMVPIVSATGESGSTNQQNAINIVQHSIETNSSAPQMNQSEFRTYVQKMSQKYGSENVKAITTLHRRTRHTFPTVIVCWRLD